jgi:hypothetical protein
MHRLPHSEIELPKLVTRVGGRFLEIYGRGARSGTFSIDQTTLLAEELNSGRHAFPAAHRFS